jgi:hypothetical protein
MAFQIIVVLDVARDQVISAAVTTGVLGTREEARTVISMVDKG